MNMANDHKYEDVSVLDEAKSALDGEAARLASLIYTHTSQDGTYASPIHGLYVNRYSQVEAADDVHTMLSPVICIAAQGKKRITVGKDAYEYSASRMYIAPVALPVAMKIMQASPQVPLLGIGLYLDPQRIAALLPMVFPNGLPEVRNRSACYVIEADLAMMNAAARLMACLSSPDDAQMLAPLVKDEIYIRLLRSPIGVYVAETVLAESGMQQVAKAIDWLQNNFSQPWKVADLAELVHMSESSFREYFRSATAMSPLQYQKVLRLQEARRLMLSSSIDATTASRLVGYLSDSQFSRDYSRFFGCPPTRDITRWRQDQQQLK